MSDDTYMLIRVKHRWVPWWLWRIASRWMPLARLLTSHCADECECPCHDTVGIRDCAFCGDKA